MVLKKLTLTAATGLLLAACAGSGVARPDATRPAAVHPDAAHLGVDVAPENELARDVLAAFESASNAHDFAALEALLTPDATWYREDVAVFQGREEVLAPLAYDEATSAQFELQNISFDGTRVRCEIVERNDFFRALEVDAIRQSVEFELRGDQIQAIRSLRRAQVSPGEKTVGRFLDWLARERREDFLRLMNAPFEQRAALARELVETAALWTADGQPG